MKVQNGLILVIWISLVICENGIDEKSDNKEEIDQEKKKKNNIKKEVQEGTKKKLEDEKDEEDVSFDVKKLKGVEHFDKPKKIKYINFNIEDIVLTDYVIRKSINEPINYKLTPINGREIKSISLKGLNAWKKEENTVCREVTIYTGHMTVMLFRFKNNEEEVYRPVLKGEDGYKFLSIFEFMVLVNQPKKETKEGMKKEKEVKSEEGKTETKEKGVSDRKGSVDKSNSSSSESMTMYKTTTVATGTLDIESNFDKKYFDFRLVRDKNVEINKYQPSWSEIHTVTQGKVLVYTTIPVRSSTGVGTTTEKNDVGGTGNGTGAGSGEAKDASVTKDGDTASGADKQGKGVSDDEKKATDDKKTLQYDNKIISVTVYLKDERPMMMEIITTPTKEHISGNDSAKSADKTKVETVNRYYKLEKDKWIETDPKELIESLNTHFKEVAGKDLHRVLGEPVTEKEDKDKEKEKKETTKINLQKNDYKIHFSMAIEDFKYVRTRPIKKVESIMNGTELVYQELLEDCEIGWAKGQTIELMEVHSRDSNVYFVNSNPENADGTKKWHETSQIRFIQIVDRLISSKNKNYVTITGKQERELVDKIPGLESKEDESSFMSNKGIMSMFIMIIIVLM